MKFSSSFLTLEESLSCGHYNKMSQVSWVWAQTWICFSLCSQYPQKMAVPMFDCCIQMWSWYFSYTQLIRNVCGRRDYHETGPAIPPKAAEIVSIAIHCKLTQSLGAMYCFTNKFHLKKFTRLSKATCLLVTTIGSSSRIIKYKQINNKSMNFS